MTNEELLSYDKITPQIAAQYLHRGVDTIRFGLQAKMFPFGIAFRRDEKSRWIYDIQAQALINYKEGRLN